MKSILDKIGDSSTGNESGITINLSISGTTVNETNPPIPTGFYHVGNTTIADGYVISDVQGDDLANSQGGNQFVWVPVQKDQVISLSVTSGEDITSIVLYNPYGDKIINLTNQGKSYSTTINTYGNMDCINGKYTAIVTTSNEIESKALVVRSLYATDTFNDYYTSDEYAATFGYSTMQAMIEDYLSEDGIYRWDGYENEADFVEQEGEEGWTLADILEDGGYESIYEWMGYTDYEEYAEDIIAMYGYEAGSKLKHYTDLTEAEGARVLYSESVNNHGGFYIGRYEAGAETARTSGNINDTVSTIITANGTPVSKANQTGYNYITRDQAKGLVESMYNSEEFTCTLLTGAAWHRTLGFLTETGTNSKTVSQMTYDSTTWGNYNNAEFPITNTSAKYSTNNGGLYTGVSSSYTKPENNSVLLTTGATERNISKNIYDLAGNVWEWTSESSDFIYSGIYIYDKIFRGGGYDRIGSINTANSSRHQP